MTSSPSWLAKLADLVSAIGGEVWLSLQGCASLSWLSKSQGNGAAMIHEMGGIE
jgi:hypothetical protein